MIGKKRMDIGGNNQVNMEAVVGKRETGLDMLRMVAMMMVVVLHYLSKGHFLASLSGSESLTGTQVTAWILEAFCVVAVNVYMLISGYFLSQTSFKLSRMIHLYVKLWLFSVVVGLFCMVTGIMPDHSVYSVLQLVLPVTMSHYWFMTAYFFLYLLLPILGMAAKKMNKAQFQLVLAMLLITYCIAKSVLPIRLETDERGYNFVWYVCVFLVAAYLRRFPIQWLEKGKNALGLYIGGAVLIFMESFILRAIYLKTGALGLIMSVPIEYNHIFVLVAALGLFYYCKQLRLPDKCGTICSKFAPFTLGVYLLHENIGMRFEWPKWLGSTIVGNPITLVIFVLLAVIVVFTLGVALDMFFSGAIKRVHALLRKLYPYGKLVEKVQRVDHLFVEE